LAQKWRAVSVNNKLIVIFSGITMLATVVYSVVAGWTLVEIHTGASDTHTLAAAAKQQAEKMGTMSDAAEKIRQASENMVTQEQRIADNAKTALEASNKQSNAALHQTLEGSRLDQRAWISLNGLGPAPELDKPWNLSVFFINTGKTPAKGVQVGCTVEPAANEEAITWSIPHENRPTLIPPNGKTMCVLHPVHAPTVAKESFDLLNDPNFHLYVYGFSIYQDIFGKWHWLTFCESDSPGAKQWEDCVKGNDTGDGNIPPLPFDKAHAAN
jgi:hypothetical protein